MNVHENCNFSMDMTEREYITLENLIFFIIFMVFMKICNFSINITERDRILLENLIFHENWKFSVNITERDRILLKNLIFLLFFIKTIIFQLKTLNGSVFQWKI